MDTSTGLVLVAAVPIGVAILQYFERRAKVKDEKQERAEAREAAREAVESARQAAKDAKEAAAAAVLQTSAVAKAAEGVRTELQIQGTSAKTQMDEIAKVGVDTQRVGIDTHTLVNNNMGVQLKLAAGYARRLANITKAAEDEQAAAIAELALAEHLKKQAVVDSGVKTSPTTG